MQKTDPVHTAFRIASRASARRGLESARAIVLGSLNLVFGYGYLLVSAVILFLPVGTTLLPIGELASLITIFSLIWTGLSLILSGLLLLGRKPADHRWILSVAFFFQLMSWILLIALLVIRAGKEFAGLFLLFYGLEAVILLLYPFVTMLISRNRECLGLD